MTAANQIIEDLSRFEGEGGPEAPEQRTQDQRQPDPSTWKEIVARYQKPATWRAVWQVVNTLVPYAALWYLMSLSLAVSWWITVPLAILAGGFLVRVFIISHDCGHGSFFRSRRANDILGFITGVLTFAPYYHWRWEHALHHATSGDLDKRGTGDIWTLTVQEYLESSRWKRIAYRLARNPIVLFVIAPLYVFVVKHRFPKSKANRRERDSVYWTNLAIFGMAAGLSCVFGIKAYLVIQLVIMLVAGSAGIWLFYVQHQFEGVYWERRAEWDYTAAALKGSSFYKLPKMLQWFSGNIGFHHIHHLSPRIPNYHLEKCHKAEPLFQSVNPVTQFSSLKSFTFRLWDEQRCKVGRLRPPQKSSETAEKSRSAAADRHAGNPDIELPMNTAGQPSLAGSALLPGHNRERAARMRLKTRKRWRSSMKVACHRSHVASRAPLGSEESRMPWSQLVDAQRTEDRSRTGTAPARVKPRCNRQRLKELWRNGRPPFANKKGERNIMVTKTTTFGGALLVVTGLLGFIAPGFIGMHLSAAHNVVLLLSGALAIYFGLMATESAGRTFCLVLGAVYGLLGLAGFVVGGTDYTYTIIPGALVLGTTDNLVHLIFGAVFLSVGWGWRSDAARPPTR